MAYFLAVDIGASSGRHIVAWKENGEVAGLVEISMVIPEDMPHYVR